MGDTWSRTFSCLVDLVAVGLVSCRPGWGSWRLCAPLLTPQTPPFLHELCALRNCAPWQVTKPNCVLWWPRLRLLCIPAALRDLNSAAKFPVSDCADSWELGSLAFAKPGTAIITHVCPCPFSLICGSQAGPRWAAEACLCLVGASSVLSKAGHLRTLVRVIKVDVNIKKLSKRKSLNRSPVV